MYGHCIVLIGGSVWMWHSGQVVILILGYGVIVEVVMNLQPYLGISLFLLTLVW